LPNFDSGVKAYIFGEYTIKIHFPVDWNDKADVCCYQCRMFNKSTGLCRITNEVSEYPSKYIGSKCPLQFDGTINEVL
jgi:hypothetical protein